MLYLINDINLLEVIFVYLIAGLGIMLLLYYFGRLSLNYWILLDVEIHVVFD